MIESQQTIGEWADETFGKAKSNLSIAIRAQQEMSELLRAIDLNEHFKVVSDEAADVVIALMRLAHNAGFNLEAAVDIKMGINREREWNVDENGHGQHKESLIKKLGPFNEEPFSGNGMEFTSEVTASSIRKKVIIFTGEPDGK